MKKNFFIGWVCLIPLFFSLSLSSLQAQTVWDGTADITWYDAAQNSFDIATPEQLAGLAQLVNNSVSDFSGKTINLVADIWLNENAGDTANNWNSIGGGTQAVSETSGNPKYFKGDFNGNGHTVHNMYCNNEPYFQAGLFGAVQGPMTIEKLAMANPVVKGAGMLGAIIGFTSSGGTVYIKNCMVMNAAITGSSGNNIGCFVGANYPNSFGTYIQSCGATGIVFGNYAGGFGGNCQYETFTNCYFAGSVTEPANQHVGGIAGYSGTVADCYSNVTSFGEGNSGTLKDTTYMKSAAFLLDLDTTFKMDCSLNNGYPIQTWQVCGAHIEGNLRLCNGESTTLSAGEFSTYLWNTGETTPSITVAPTTTTDYSVTVTDENNEQSCDTVTVTVYPQAIITATAMPAADGITHGTVTPDIAYVACGGTELVTLTITPDIGYHISGIVMNGTVLREDDPADEAVVSYSINPNGTFADVEVYFSNVYQITVSMTLEDNTAFSIPNLVSPWGNNGVYTTTYGSEVEYHFYENARYHLVEVLIDGTSHGIIHSYTFSNIDRNSTIALVYQDTCGIISLPWFDNFDSYSNSGWSVLPDCWTRGGSSTDYPRLDSYNNHSAPNCLSFYYYDVSYAILPAIDTLAYPINTLQVSYNLKVGATSPHFIVGVMTDPNNISTFTPISSHQNTAVGVWETHIDYLIDFNGYGQYIAFKWEGASYNDDCFLDDVEISMAPDCSPVLNITVTNVAYDNNNGGIATINWEPGIVGSPTSYILEYKPMDEDTWNTVSNLTDTTYTLTGLASVTGYDVRVSADCGTATMSDWTYSVFAVSCDTADMCYYKLTLASSNPWYTWGNATLDIYLNGVYSQSFTYDNTTSGICNFSVCDGSAFELRFGEGYSSFYQDYIMFTLTDPFGIVLFTCNAGDALSYLDGDLIYSGIISCQPPQCVRPDNVSVVGGVTGAEVSWIDIGTTSQGWLIEYGPEGFTPGTGTTEMAFSSPYTIVDLDSNTVYDLYIRTYCGEGDTSYYTDRVNFQTYLCEEYERCNYTFYLHDTYGDGWNGNSISVYSDGNHVTDITLLSGYSDTITVPLCHNSIVTLVWHNTSYANETSFSITNFYYNDIIYNCLNGNTLSTDSAFFTFTPDCTLPICLRPENVNATSITTISADINWTETDDASSYIIEYDTTGFIPGTGITVNTSAMPYTLNGLTANTYYDVYVRTLCGDGDTSVRTPVYTFSTTCDNISTLPFIENFDGNNIHDGYIDCWIRHSSDPEHYVYVREDNTQSYSPSSMLDFHYTPDCFVMAVLPSFDPSIALNSLTVTFQSRTANNTVGVKEIGIMTDPDDTTTYQRIAVINHAANNQYEEFEIPLNNYTGTGSSIAFKYSNGPGTQFLIDNLKVDYSPVCISPTALTASNPTVSSMDISWTERGTATAWNIEYGTEGFTLGTGTTTSVTDTFHTLNGLAANTRYEAYVQADCGSGDVSTWVGPLSFKTACTAVTIPYAYNFDSDVANNHNDFPDCWIRINYGDYYWFPEVSNYYSHSPANALHYLASYSSFYSEGYALLPYVDVAINPVNTLQLSFYGKGSAYSSDMSRVIVGVMEDPTDISGFLPVDTIDIASANFEEFMVMFNDYQGTGSYITLKFPTPDGEYSYNELYIDDIYLETIPSCPCPSELAGTTSTTNSVTLSWTETGSATEWEIIYGTPGFDPATAGTTVQAATNPFTVTGLSASTTYDFYVRAVCSPTDISTWSRGTSYTTQCDVITTFPYTEDFENNGNMPNCWTQEQITLSLNWRFGAGTSSGTTITIAHSGNYNAYYYNASFTTAVTKLISPIFDLTQISNPYVSFWHTQEAWGTDQDELKVYYRTSATDTWTQLVHYTSNITAWTFDSLSLPNPSATYQLAFEGSAAYGHGIALDDITVDGMAVDCPMPTGLTADAGVTSAILSWTGTGNFEVSYKETSAADWSANTPVTGNTTTLTGLTPNTGYDWRVRQVCDGPTYSDWATGTFQTSEEAACPTPTNLTVSNITDNSATLSWEQEGDVSVWTLNYRRAEEGATWTTSTIYTNPYTIVGLTANTNYQAQIRANCGNDIYSDYTDIITFTTNAIGIEDYALSNCIALYPNPTSAYIDVKFSRDIQVSELKVYDVYGKLLQTIQVNENPTRIDVSALANGVYFVRAFTENGIANKSFIKR